MLLSVHERDRTEDPKVTTNAKDFKGGLQGTSRAGFKGLQGTSRDWPKDFKGLAERLQGTGREGLQGRDHRAAQVEGRQSRGY